MSTQLPAQEPVRTPHRIRALIVMVAIAACGVCCAPKQATMTTLPCADEVHANPSAARAKFSAEAAKAPDDIAPQLCIAYAAIAQHRYSEAVEAATRALTIEKGNALALRMRAFARYRLGAFNAAIEDAERSLRSATDGEAYEIIGKCHLRQGDARAAIEDFRVWANLSGLVEARCWMGAAQWTAGDRAGGLKTWEAAELAAPKDPEPFIWKAGFLFRGGDRGAALEAAQRAAELEPTSPQALGTLARVQSWSGDGAGAQATVKRLAVTDKMAAEKLQQSLQSQPTTELETSGG
ncbi:MAG: tetratricopeptide repeat protein [Planctomycetota bacterium]